MPGLSFLSKKKWHTSNFKNVEKVWVAEQKSEQEQKRLAEFQKQLLEERQIQELRQLQAAQGQVVKHTDNSLDWMYEGPGGGSQAQKDSEEYLLGKIYKPQQSNTFEVGSAPVMSQGNNSSSTWVNKVSNKNDIFSRKHEDPMIVIKQAEKAQRDRVVNNPIQMEKIRQNVAKHLEEMDYARDRSRRARDELQSHIEVKRELPDQHDSDDDTSSHHHHRSGKSDKKKHKKHKKEKRSRRYDSDEDVSRSCHSDLEEKKRKHRHLDNEDDNNYHGNKKRPNSENRRREVSRSRSLSSQRQQQSTVESNIPIADTPAATEFSQQQSSREHVQRDRSNSPSNKKDDRHRDVQDESRHRDVNGINNDRNDRVSYRDDRKKRDSRSRSPPRRERYHNERERDRHSRERDRNSRDRERRYRDSSRDRQRRSEKKSSMEAHIDKYGRDHFRRDRSRSRDRIQSSRKHEDPKEEPKGESILTCSISEQKSWGLVFKGRQAPPEKDENGVKSLGPCAELLRKKEEERQQEEKLRQENLRRSRGYHNNYSNSSSSTSANEEERLARLRAMTQDAEVINSNRLTRNQIEASSEGDFKDQAIRAQQAGKSAEFISHMRSEVLRSAGETTGIKERLDTHKHYVQRGTALDDSNATNFLKR